VRYRCITALIGTIRSFLIGNLSPIDRVVFRNPMINTILGPPVPLD
jgi:hypothetical protein